MIHTQTPFGAPAVGQSKHFLSEIMPQLNEITPSLWQKVQDALKNVFHLPGFRDGQEEIVRSVLSGHQTLAVMPTGSGKSLCYQLPGLVLPGLVLVISPLIALMKDQVDSLISKGIRAANLHSGLDWQAQQTICNDVASGAVKFLFVAPERIRNANFQAILHQVPLGLLAVDEAHCISQWGHDFRPDYRRLGELRRQLNNPITIALTATASPAVQKDIVAELGLSDPASFILGFDRLNLRFGVRIFRSETEKLQYAFEYVSQRIQHRCGFQRKFSGCGILYASTIKQAEKAYAYLSERGIRVGLYHAGLQPAVRTKVQEQFMNDEFHCLIATTAFGMGVDKPDIRYVLHLSMSSSVEAYTQESGRAGRDRNPAECMLLYSGADTRIQESFIEQGSPDLMIYSTLIDVFAHASHADAPVPGTHIDSQTIADAFDQKMMAKVNTALRKIRARDLIVLYPDASVSISAAFPRTLARTLAKESDVQKRAAKGQLKDLLRYIYDENCRTKFILNYFGSRDARTFKNCSHCDLCGAIPIRPLAGQIGDFPPEPICFVVQKYLSTIIRCSQAHIPVSSRQAADILIGSTAVPAFSGISTFGLLGYMDAAEIRVLAGVLRDAGFIAEIRGFLHLTAAGKGHLFDKKTEEYPAMLHRYLSLRFPHAPKDGEPWRP